MSTTAAPTPTQPTSNPRVKLIRNKNFKRNALVAYGSVLRKYNIKPNLPGPFTMIDELVHGGEHITAPLRWRYGQEPAKKQPVAQRKLMQRDADSKSGMVEANNIQNDTEYLVRVDSKS